MFFHLQIDVLEVFLNRKIILNSHVCEIRFRFKLFFFCEIDWSLWAKLHMASSLGVQINPSAPLSATHLSLSTPVSTSLLLPSGCTHGHPSTNSLIPSECENYYNPTSLLVPSECNDGATSTALIPSECNNGQISRPRCQHPGRRLIGTRIYDSILGVSCHWCRQKTVEDHVRCCECTVAFCGGCLKNRHGEFVQIEMQAWKIALNFCVLEILSRVRARTCKCVICVYLCIHICICMYTKSRQCL